MTGTHGSKDGETALSDTDLIGHSFYEEDCQMFGIEAGPFRSKQRPPLSEEKPLTDEDWKKIPDITKPAEKIENPPADSLCNENDGLMNKMDVRIANLPYYYKNTNKLERDIKQECLIKPSNN